ncbi:MAG: glycosyltransferase 87 family protein [Candidatus Methanoplasma sp.]|nr:glycosyltransferase 87 family protein [Candidatus Methanoplasma sp.]
MKIGDIVDGSVRRHQLFLGIIFAVASVVFLVVVYQTGIESETVRYLPYANEILQGRIPAMEYPPFAIVFLTIPRLFSSSEFGYQIAFVAEVFVFFLIGLVMMSKLAKRYRQSQHIAMILYTVLVLLLFEFAVDRFDIFPMILTLLSFYCLVTKRYAWAFLILSVATMTKLYPVFLFPIYLIPFFFNRDWKNMLRGAGIFIAAAAIIFLPFYVFGADAAFNFFGSNVDRALQIESLPASVIYFIHMLGLTDVSISPFQPGVAGSSDNLVGALPDAVAPMMMPLTGVIIAAALAWYAYSLYRMRTDGRDNEDNRLIVLCWAALLTVMAFMLFNKVFSSQYLIWIIPFLTIFLMTSIDFKHKRYVLILSVAAIILTQLNFAVNIGISGGGTGITDGGMMIILARNIVMLALFILIVWISKDNLKKKYTQERSVDSADGTDEREEVS